ncbi:uncharacterized protein ACR2FA_005325 [Aphomia sociella]
MPPKSNLCEQTIYKLIQEVKNREFLWNTENEDYNNRYQNAVAWKEISDSLELPVDLIRMKWKGLRDSFKKELKRYSATSIEDYKGKWQYMEVLSFIYKPEDFEQATTDYDDTEREPVSFVQFSEDFVNVDPDDNDYKHEDPIPTPANRDIERRTYTEEEYDLMFLKSLVPFFRHLDPVRKLVLRNKIQDMVLNEIASQNTSGKVYNMFRKS